MYISHALYMDQAPMLEHVVFHSTPSAAYRVRDQAQSEKALWFDLCSTATAQATTQRRRTGNTVVHERDRVTRLHTWCAVDSGPISQKPPCTTPSNFDISRMVSSAWWTSVKDRHHPPPQTGRSGLISYAAAEDWAFRLWTTGYA